MPASWSHQSHTTPLVERAYQLAAKGMTIVQVRAALKAEGYNAVDVSAHLNGFSLAKSLRRMAAEGIESRS